MSYKDNVQELCDKVGLENPIREDDLSIARLFFYTSLPSGVEVLSTIEATDMNRAGRLFIQAHLTGPGEHSLANLRETAAQFFTDALWNDCSEEKRSLVHGIKTADSVEVIYKRTR